MNSSRPYLVRALYEWIVDNDCTPHMLVNSDYPKVQVPAGFASDGQIVLNVPQSWAFTPVRMARAWCSTWKSLWRLMTRLSRMTTVRRQAQSRRALQADQA